ncbi:MAG: shikimate kinase [Ruminococcaceae bacterium]|nr:shikimate kinase [Oscillospiraceae bacterium]
MNCGLLGRHLTHSYSPQIHSHLGTYPYGLFEIEPEDLKDFFTKKAFDGINITIPYKKAAVSYCDSLSPQAQRLGSVNTVVKTEDGKLIGHNTDYFGFASLLQKSTLSVSGKKVLVLGSGGASVTVEAVLHEQKADVVIISRNGENNYQNLHLHKDASVIVNATPVGMYPNNGVSPVDLSLFPKLEGVIDLIYNPARTKLLLEAESRGLIAENGLWMLVAQAKESAEWFTGAKISDDKISHIYQLLKLQMENLILIGMPGCGKSTVGKRLAEITGRKFIDADAAITEKVGISIPEIFAKGGENAFRSIEISVLSEICKGSGLVIATGGGCVTKKENYPILHQNGRIIWLKRDISALPTDGRPLSQSNDLTEMYHKRAPLYQSFADLTVDNNAQQEETAERILGGL